MRVRVTVTVDIDPERWIGVYGVEPADVRSDVKEYITTSVRDLYGIVSARLD